MADQEPVVDVEAVEEPGTALAPVEHHQPTTLFRTDDPVEVVERAARVADALQDILKKKGMVKNIKGRDHVLVEGWQTLGSMLGVVPVLIWTRELPDGWEARVEARTLDGRVVGAAEAMCTRSEGTWKSRDAYALRSMAQTRATSKALRGPLGFVVTLAGYEATPAEEMPVQEDRRPQPEQPPALTDERALGQLTRAGEIYDEIKGLPGGLKEVPAGKFNAWVAAAHHSHDRLDALIAHLEGERDRIKGAS